MVFVGEADAVDEENFVLLGNVKILRFNDDAAAAIVRVITHAVAVGGTLFDAPAVFDIQHGVSILLPLHEIALGVRGGDILGREWSLAMMMVCSGNWMSFMIPFLFAIYDLGNCLG